MYLNSSWIQSKNNEVVSHLELKLVPEYDGLYLTCRIITKAPHDKGFGDASKQSKDDFPKFSNELAEYFESSGVKQGLRNDKVQKQLKTLSSNTQKYKRSSKEKDKIKIEMLDKMFHQNMSLAKLYVNSKMKSKHLHHHHHHRMKQFDKNSHGHKKANFRSKNAWNWETTISDTSLRINMFRKFYFFEGIYTI